MTDYTSASGQANQLRTHIKWTQQLYAMHTNAKMHVYAGNLGTSAKAVST